MSFVAPWLFAAGALAALGVLALHLLSTQRPPERVLPTARFVPETDLRAVSRTSRPTDLPLLLLRMLALLALGAGFARPVVESPGPAVRTVHAVEWTSALDDADALRTRVLAALAERDTLVVFDTAAVVMDAERFAAMAAPSVRRAALSPMLVAARDAATGLARGADSLRLVVYSALPADAVDAATNALRARWPGRVELERVDANRSLAATDTLAPGVRLEWLASSRDSLRPDAVIAFDGVDAALVGLLARHAVPEGRVLARWRDGTPAVTERPDGDGCVRSIGVGLPAAGDLPLRASYARFREALGAPCGGARLAALSDSAWRALAGDGPLALASAFIEDAPTRSPLAAWLLLVAILALLAEQWLRRRMTPAEAAA